MTRVAWWHCFSGITGEMALGSLLDAGADLGEVTAGLRALGLDGWHIEVAKARRGTLVATCVEVQVAAGQDDWGMNWGTLRGILAQTKALPRSAVERAQETFAALARAQGRLRDLPPEQVQIHEVGGLGAVVGVVGTCLALGCLDIGTVMSSPVTLGTGTVTGDNGVLPNPAPVVVELLKGAPVSGSDEPSELTAPAGAALLAATCQSFGPLPPMRVSASGYGAGGRELADRPNLLQVVVGEMDEAGLGGLHQELALLETNVDDVTGETLAHALSMLLDAGALDAWLTPVVGKKGRPAHVLSVLSNPVLAPRLASLVAAETGALGIRQQLLQRWAWPRRTVRVDVDGQPVRVKAGPHRLKAEYEDCARAARGLGLPVWEVARRAEDAARRSFTTEH